MPERFELKLVSYQIWVEIGDRTLPLGLEAALSSIYSTKIVTRLKSVSYLKTACGTNRSNRRAYRLFIMNIRPDQIQVEIGDGSLPLGLEAALTHSRVKLRQRATLSLKPGHHSPHTLHPTPYTLHLTPYTLHPTPHTLHPTPYTLHPTPFTLHPTLYTRSGTGACP